ncbi:LEA type 2 family protein [Desulfobacca acetoxidans]|uniref:Water Stress and Hypersensitive response domain-containing protein n=1 Tax=Desulfobacca acetoxidans (strain ATCC 700848 / DSM 11109 / ASRB2) TaxID=880072 RepID=F2NHD3_DESAR|nr:LEA type 2 family protein [Desulfobacca acetoxidans]AEB09049.1 Water Stress and Hypersensitive response domain-containing protein [Desulfobacca acetoxidans DSM 11109]
MSKLFYGPPPVVSVFFWCVILINLMTGCGVRELASGKLAPPEVGFQGLTIYPPESECWPLSARVQLTNPNPEPMRILGYDYEVALEGENLVQGDSTDAITLPAGGTNQVDIPILLKLPAIPKTLGVLLRQEKLRYEIAGGFRLASLLGGMKVPFRFRGEITRQEGLERLRAYLGSKE